MHDFQNDASTKLKATTETPGVLISIYLRNQSMELVRNKCLATIITAAWNSNCYAPAVIKTMII